MNPQAKPSTPRAPRRDVPPDLAANAKTMCQEDLARLYRCGRSTIRKWLAEAGITAAAPVMNTKKPLPADLPEMAARMGRNALARHYDVSYNTMVRMLADAGLEAFKAPVTARQGVTGYRKMTGVAKRVHMATGHVSRDISTEGQAADVLRRYAAVYRCTERGAADPKGDWWRYGNVVLAGGELIERAQRHGWNPDAWQHLATGLAIAGCERDKARAAR